MSIWSRISLYGLIVRFPQGVSVVPQMLVSHSGGPGGSHVFGPDVFLDTFSVEFDTFGFEKFDTFFRHFLKSVDKSVES